jgi:serine/threonine-protein kinase
MKTLPCLSREELQQVLSGQVATRQAGSAERHLEQCAECRQRLESLAAGSDWWRAAEEHLSSDEIERTLALRTTRDLASGDLAESNRGRSAARQSPALQPPSHPEMLGRLGRFDIESWIGQGGFGVVYKGHDPELNRAVAIKVLAPHLAASGVARKRFAREAQAAAAISHPNVVPIHAIESEGDCPYLVMSYVPGQSLQAYVQKHGPLPIKAVVRIAQQIAAGLLAAHRQGLVHRDIKPANILLENGLNRAMITDFGLARAADDAALTQTGWLAGTPFYMSPEQAEGKAIDERSDLFSLGSVIYFMATGREPFRGDQPLAVLRKIVNERPAPAEQANSDVPRTLSRLIERLHEKQPEDRYQSAEQVNQLLEQYVAHLNQPLAHDQPRLGLSRRSVRTRIGWTAAAALSCVLLGALGYGLANWFAAPAVPPAPPPRLSIVEYQQELRQLEAPVQLWVQELSQLESSIRAVEVVPLRELVTEPVTDPLQAELDGLNRVIRLLEQQNVEPSQAEQNGHLPSSPPSAREPSKIDLDLPQASSILKLMQLRLAANCEIRAEPGSFVWTRILSESSVKRWLLTFRIHQVVAFLKLGVNQ